VTVVQANGIGVHVAQLASTAPGPLASTIVMLHGMAQDSLASWYFTLAQPLHLAGARVVMYDLRGHGRSERPATGYRLEDFIDDLGSVLDGLGVAEPVYLLGNSFGGTIAFSYAIRHPERVAGIVAIESAPPTDGWMRRVVRRLESAARHLPAHPVPADQARRPAARAARDILVNTTLVRDIAASRLPSEAQIASIRCPVLCLYGGDSQVAQFAPGVRDRLPQAQTVIVPGGRHSMLIDQPARIHRLVSSWLAQHQPAESGSTRDRS
jgi:pimeloyl-ACP methyl ester carboxylesterase